MTAIPLPEVWLSKDGRTFHMRRGGWEASFPVTELARWLEFYRRLRDRSNGKFAHVYAPEVRELERIKTEVRNR